MPTLLSKRSIQNSRLYVIVDRAVLSNRDPVKTAEAAIRGGADVIQWRDKSASDAEFLAVARALRELTRDAGTIFIINDRVHIAEAVRSDGVHVGHADLPVARVRSLVGQTMLIGRSTHSLEEALAAERSGADYIGVGPVFSTPTKPDYRAVGTDLLGSVKSHVRIPWVAIGGIDLENLPLVLSAGAPRVAVVRAVAAASDPERAALCFKEQLPS